MNADLSKHTYMVRHNPNCPSPFEIRTCGDAFHVDPREQRNFISYGKTFDEAARRALELLADRDRLERIRYSETEVVGVVWA